MSEPKAFKKLFLNNLSCNLLPCLVAEFLHAIKSVNAFPAFPQSHSGNLVTKLDCGVQRTAERLQTPYSQTIWKTTPVSQKHFGLWWRFRAGHYSNSCLLRWQSPVQSNHPFREIELPAFTQWAGGKSAPPFSSCLWCFSPLCEENCFGRSSQAASPILHEWDNWSSLNSSRAVRKFSWH